MNKMKITGTITDEKGMIWGFDETNVLKIELEFGNKTFLETGINNKMNEVSKK